MSGVLFINYNANGDAYSLYSYTIKIIDTAYSAKSRYNPGWYNDKINEEMRLIIIHIYDIVIYKLVGWLISIISITYQSRLNLFTCDPKQLWQIQKRTDKIPY